MAEDQNLALQDVMANLDSGHYPDHVFCCVLSKLACLLNGELSYIAPSSCGNRRDKSTGCEPLRTRCPPCVFAPSQHSTAGGRHRPTAALPSGSALPLPSRHVLPFRCPPVRFCPSVVLKACPALPLPSCHVLFFCYPTVRFCISDALPSCPAFRCLDPVRLCLSLPPPPPPHQASCPASCPLIRPYSLLPSAGRHPSASPHIQRL